MQKRATEFALCLAGHVRDDSPVRLAEAAESRGFSAFFLPDNSHVPVVRRGPDKFSGDMRELAQFYDPFVTLAACAAVTSTIQLGTSVALLTQRDHLALARTVASLDHMSNGRVILGVAGGFVREAMTNHGAGFKSRWQLVAERVAAMRSIWRDPSPAYSGGLVELPQPCMRWPTVQADGPAVLIGSNSREVPERVVSWADGWLVRPPLYPGDPFSDLAQACANAGRPPETVRMVLMDAPWDPESIEAAVSRGFQQLVHVLRTTDESHAYRQMDRLTDWLRRLA